MNNIWNYKIELKNEDVFDEIAKIVKKPFPDDLRSFVMEHNAASPEKNCIDINNVEHVYDETLSFNKEEDEVLTARFVMDTIDCDGYIPFARDPFGNYFIYSVDSGLIAYYMHEEQTIDETKMSLEEFVNGLH